MKKSIVWPVIGIFISVGLFFFSPLIGGVVFLIAIVALITRVVYNNSR